MTLAANLGFVVSDAAPDDADYDVVDRVLGQRAGDRQRSDLGATWWTRRADRPSRRARAVPFDEICFRELTVTSGNASTPRSWERALPLLEQGDVELGAARHRGRAARRVGARVRSRRVRPTGVKFVLDPRPT